MNAFNNIEEIKGLKKSNIYTIEEIRLWLEKHSQYYKDINKKFRCNCNEPFCFCHFKVRLKTEDELFYKIYCELEYILDLQEDEEEAKKELKKYCKIKENRNEIKKWILENELLGSRSLFSFLIQYFKKDESNLSIAYYNFEIYLEKSSFINLIEFKKLFDQLYYIERICPEREDKINAELELIKDVYHSN